VVFGANNALLHDSHVNFILFLNVSLICCKLSLYESLYMTQNLSPKIDLPGRVFIARHAETVFNADARMQGDQVHTPLTRTGFHQADAMGKALQNFLGTRQTLSLWSSPYGRTLQTLAVVCDHIGADWHTAHTDIRLREIDVGAWSGRSYSEIAAEIGPIVDPETRLFSQFPEGGESYADIAARLTSWIADTQDMHEDRLVITHGMTARILRGILTWKEPHSKIGAPLADSLPQGSLVMIGNGTERIIHTGTGTGGFTDGRGHAV
jgi:probable phosphoglycerate mutase